MILTEEKNKHDNLAKITITKKNKLKDLLDKQKDLRHAQIQVLVGQSLGSVWWTQNTVDVS